MKHWRPIRKSRGGFTLIEVLIAAVAFALVLAAINAVFYGALRLRNKTVQAMDEALPIQQALAILKRDLSNLVAPGGELSGELQTEITSSTGGMTGASGPEFYTGTGRIDGTTPFAEVQKVSYVLLESTNRLGGRDLYRMVTRNLLASETEQPAAQWLLGGVRTLVFAYYTGTEWQETWDSTVEETKMPTAIKVQVELNYDPANLMIPAPYELVIPVTVQVRTNEVQEATGGGA